jgi:RNA polymerase sigma factor (sigma-70 family)
MRDSSSVPAVRAFLDTHAALILRLARAVTRPGEGVAPEDLAQEVMVGLLRMASEGRFDPARIENVEAYLRVVVRNAANYARRRRASTEQVGRDADAGEAVELGRIELEPASSPEDLTRRALDARRRLDALKAALRPRDALVLALLVEEGLEIVEVAARLGTTLNNVYQMRHRILAAAREILGKEDAAAVLESSRGVS